MYVPLHTHPDYAHLDAPTLTGQPFALDAAVLARLRSANGFDVPLPGRALPEAPVLLALRGASLEGVWRWRRSGRRGPRPALIETGAPVLVTDHIDHERPRCVIAVWGADGELTAFQGSTVAHISWLKKQWAARRDPRRRIACTLATGRFRYTVRTHGSQDGDIPHALTQHDRLPVYRTRVRGASPTRTLPGVAEWHAAHTNIHAARTAADEHLDTFASAGCMTVPGTRSDGPWQTFVARASGADGVQREVIVLTGAEALQAADGTRALPRLARAGSSKAHVEALQARHGLHVDGDFGPKTFRAWVRHGPVID